VEYVNFHNLPPRHTDKKENKIFLIYKEIHSGAVAKSYMRKGFLIYEEMRKYLVTYEEATAPLWITSDIRKFFFSASDTPIAVPG
jgi:hypothetical protein